ncbi:uncharacterized protein LOC143862203 [Tasmannia lanceolata]|uniref:uncharacterized protein LOC143862203 n=1 Tax=Tasmannia lanceolata TaxID=3420 RepID=UPI00406286AE
MSNVQKPNSPENTSPLHPPSRVVPSEIGSSRSPIEGKKPKFPNPPETEIPDVATLRDQWRFAIRQYSRWYSQAWGTAIFAGLSFFALGWFIKGSNPLPSKQDDDPKPPSSDRDR